MFKNLFLIIALFSSMSLFATETIQTILTKNNIPKDQVFNFMVENPDLIGFKIFKTKFLTDTDAELKLKLYIENSSDIIMIEKNGDYIYLYDSESEYKFEKKTYEGQVKGTLYDSILNDIGSAKLASELEEAFKEEFTTAKKLKVEALYSFVVETLNETNEAEEFHNILSAKLIVGKATVEKVLKRDREDERLVLKTLLPEDSERIFESPVETKRVSSLFNLARKHPVKRRIQPHNGIDFVAKSGTPVYPALGGKIIAIGRAKAKGKFVLIQHENGFQSTYDHLRKFQKGIKVGMTVEISDQIGEVGRTGYATGAHLHFGILKNGFYVNPILYLRDYQLAESDDANFEEYDDSTRDE